MEDLSGAQKDLNNMYEVFHDLNFEIKWKPFVDRTTLDLKNELIKCKFVFIFW
jgi:hypothetical protein